MDYLVEAADKITTISDQLVPPGLPVPTLITKGAKIIADTFAAPSFPYRFRYINLGNEAFWEAAIVILLQPVIWNFLARLEYKTRILSKMFIKPTIAVYALALWITLAGLYRDALFVIAMDTQQTLTVLGTPELQLSGFACLTIGTVLVFSSFYRLGIKGTYLGDYFGFLLDAPVTSFPFNVLSDPMYDGSTLIFLGKAILGQSPAGVLLAAWVYVVYRLACVFEGSFTEHIYATRESVDKKTQ